MEAGGTGANSTPGGGTSSSLSRSRHRAPAEKRHKADRTPAPPERAMSVGSESGPNESDTSDNPPPPPISGPNAALFERMRADISELSSDVGNISTKVKATENKILGYIQQFDTANQSRFNKLDADIADVRVSQEAQAKTNAELFATLAEVQKQLAIAEKCVPDKSDVGTNYQRDPNPTILRANTAEIVSLEDFEKSWASFMEEASITPDKYKIIGATNGAGVRFSIHFSGAGGLAASRVRKVLELRKDSEGSWRDLSVTTKSHRNIKLYIAPDKNRFQTSREISTKHMFQVIKQTLSDRDIRISSHNPKGIVFADGKPLTNITPVEEGPPTVLWDNTRVTELNIPKDKIIEAFTIRNSPSPVQWSS